MSSEKSGPEIDPESASFFDFEDSDMEIIDERDTSGIIDNSELTQIEAEKYVDILINKYRDADKDERIRMKEGARKLLSNHQKGTTRELGESHRRALQIFLQYIFESEGGGK